jgi:hypothetical protein
MTHAILHADLLAHLRGNRWLVQNGYIPKSHAILCDPPYGLEFMGKEWDKPKPSGLMATRSARDPKHSDTSKRPYLAASVNQYVAGEDFQHWVTEWAGLLLDYVHPGALGLFFGGTRTYHRLAAGLEDAGWTVTDTLAWVTGQGFPKSLSLEKATNDPKWAGFGSAMKPSFEPCVVARAPRGKRTYAALAREFGTGALAIDAARIGTDADDPNIRQSTGGYVPTVTRASVPNAPYNHTRDATLQQGRWPANFALVCTCESDDHAADCPVAVLGAQSGESVSTGGTRPQFGSIGGNGIYSGTDEARPYFHYGDVGSAARFFYQAKAAAWERIAGLSARSTHPTHKPIRLAEYLARLILPPVLDEPRRLLVPFAGSGSEMIGALLAGWDDVTGIEREAEYVAIARARVAWWAQFATYDAARKAHEKAKREPIILPAPVVSDDKPTQIALFEEASA